MPNAAVPTPDLAATPYRVVRSPRTAPLRELLDAALDPTAARELAGPFLAQLARPELSVRAVLLYGSKYWKEIINFDALVRHGTIDREDLRLFQFADDPATAFATLRTALTREPEKEPAPAFAHSHTPRNRAAARRGKPAA